jgi:hypothetical protein
MGWAEDAKFGWAMGCGMNWDLVLELITGVVCGVELCVDPGNLLSSRTCILFH